MKQRIRLSALLFCLLLAACLLLVGCGSTVEPADTTEETRMRRARFMPSALMTWTVTAKAMSLWTSATRTAPRRTSCGSGTRICAMSSARSCPM